MKYLMTKTWLLLSGLMIMMMSVNAQAPQRLTSTQLHDGLQKLNFLGSALYLAAHPDDENTRMIAYLSNVKHANTAYLSLTRGDGGQNLIGPEIRELLGVIRTQELLAARRTDGGKQFFSRANDFGYSKHPSETFTIWDKEDVMADVVWVIRNFKPDIIINRFDHRRAGRTHGHHTASAMLSVESYDMSGNASVYPEQLKYTEPWQPKRIFFNTSWWFYGSREAFAEADKSNMVTVDVGTYLPKRGVSVPEIAATSRSQHKSQGFGSSGTRGSLEEYLELVAGDMPEGATDPFVGVNTTWTRVAGGAPIGKAIDAALANFDFDQPANNLPALLEVRRMISALPDGHWKSIKLTEIENLIVGVTGLFVEASASATSAAAGQTVELRLEAINRSDAQLRLKGLRFAPFAADTSMMENLANNKGWKLNQTLQLPTDVRPTSAYWLNNDASLGMYAVEEQLLRGLPESPSGAQVHFDLEVYDESTKKWEKLQLERAVVFKTTDPVKGELYSPFEITAPVFVGLNEKAYIFSDAVAQEVVVKVAAGKDSLTGTVELCHPDNWRVEPAKYDLKLNKKGQEANFKFTLYPPEEQSADQIVPLVRIGEESYTNDRIKIVYDHIPTQTIIMDASAKVVRLDIKREGQYIGYIMGAGDDIPQALEQIGYTVTLLEDRDINLDRLASFDAVILGIRAYNTIERMSVYQPMLMNYVEQGGTLIVQYNTNRRLKVDMEELAPYPLKISRDRVTVEEAEVRIMAPEHPVMNEPNAITEADFENWVQERGLYFPNEWDEAYTPILSSNDPDEPARDGGLLVAQHGKGWYVYTGYSWFRELPAGVPGAYRIFANLISLGNKARP